MKQKRKTVLRQIKKWVEVLPAETYKAYHKYYSPRLETDEQGKEVWRIGYLADHPVNHYRRCKKTYDKYGLAGVDAYLRLYGYQLSS